MPPPQPPAQALDLSTALSALPPPSAAWAYGSAVFAQPGLYGAGDTEAAPMVDFLLAVDDPGAWHEANLRANPRHYTGWAARTLLGGRGLAWLADNVGAGMHFNTGLAWPGDRDGRTLKYGVVSLHRLASDLLAWDRLYAAGRLHKPAVQVAGGAGGDVLLPAVPSAGLPPTPLSAALEANRRSAAAAALLTLPPRFSLPAFRSAVVGLSYTGDVRTTVRAEDGAKVDRIAAGAARELDGLYAPHLAGPVGRAAGAVALPSLGGGGGRGGGGAPAAAVPWVQDPRPEARAALAARLPPALAARVARAAGAPTAAAAVACAVERGGHEAGASLVRAALASTVRASSARAALAGLIASGPGVAAWYVGRKLRKGWRGA